MKDATVTDKKACRTLAGKDLGVTLHVFQLKPECSVVVIKALVCIGGFCCTRSI